MTQPLHARHWIGGEWIDTDKSTESVDPAIGEPIGSYAEAGLPAAIVQYGLAASIWSSDVGRPLRVARQIDAGTVWINGWAVVYDETEEGGFKQSGLGRLNGLSALEDFVEYRTFIHDVPI